MQTFMPSPRPSLNSHMCAWNGTAAGDKTDQFIIGIAIMRRSRHANLERVAVDSDTFSSSGLGLDMHHEDRPTLTVSHDGMVGSHGNGDCQKMALTSSSIARCISASSVIGRTTATSQALAGGTPCLIKVPA